MQKKTRKLVDVFGPGDWISEDRILDAGWDPGDLIKNGSISLPILYNGFAMFCVESEIRLPQI